MDETVEEFCRSIFKYEVMLFSAQNGSLHLSKTEIELIERRIKRSEMWLMVLGRHVALAKAHERVAHYRKHNASVGMTKSKIHDKSPAPAYASRAVRYNHASRPAAEP